MPRPHLALASLLLIALLPFGAAAQPTRPWLDWKTTETPHFVFHYPSELRTWTLALAARMEGVRSQVAQVVGFAPPQRVTIIVDDPANASNGFAFTPLDAPTIVLWPTPPDPRSEIGNSRVWQELLATHEFTHVAHLVRPSRNRWQRFFESLSPVPLGPIPTKAPRWVLEGYATYVEGRVSGSGRPNNAWRSAIIRQYAMEGRLPSYGQLSATGGYGDGSFAYLVGSAYLEWLARRQGDSSIVALWRRMTAVTDRSFDRAFVGVYGDSPSTLYARFSAEVTTQAVELEQRLRREGLVDGALVQRLERDTGDPAVSPDGRYLAITVRHTDAPPELVVWRTAEEPDTSAQRDQAAQRQRDPDDVPDVRFYPAPKTAVIRLVASDGAPFETPRWMPDNKHLLVVRRVPMSDGTVRPDLYLWNAEDGELRRLTKGAGLRDADPSGDGSWAAAVRCSSGWCDLVRVDLTSGDVRVLRRGSVTRNYYRPRVSHLTGEIVVAEQAGDRWRVARVAPNDGTLRYADPDDGVTRYDATYAPDGVSLVVTSEATGIANLERLDTLRGVTPVSSVTGAAVAADVAPNGAVWYLALQGHGYDVRRIDPGTTVRRGLPVSVALADSLQPVLPPRLLRLPFDSSARPARGLVSDEEPYGTGPSRMRYLPAVSSGFGGSTAQLAFVRSDPVGRLGVSVLGAAGAGALPSGLSARVSLRSRPTRFTASGWLSHEDPSREYAAAGDAGLDLARRGGAVGVARTHVFDGGELRGSATVLAERQEPTGFEPWTRTAGIITFSASDRQRDEEVRYLLALSGLGEAGRAGDGRYLRHRSELLFGTASGGNALSTVRLQYGTVGGGDGTARELFAIGGIPSPLIDPQLDARRVEAPAYPTGSVMGSNFSGLRVGIPVQPVELFYSAVGPNVVAHALRSYGAELRERLAALPALATPEIDLLAGVARALDAPVRGTWRYYISVGIRP
jgi:Periplasmic component of the Tol biopolymer transport system